jgi:superkiller protein 3
MVVNTLAALGIVTEDDALVDAALSEIVSLPYEQRAASDPRRDISYLLIQHALGQVRSSY